MRNRPIHFDFEDRKYAVSMDWYSVGGFAKLPDGRLLQNSGWLGSLPPQPTDLRVVSSHLRRTVHAAILLVD